MRVLLRAIVVAACVVLAGCGEPPPVAPITRTFVPGSGAPIDGGGGAASATRSAEDSASVGDAGRCDLQNSTLQDSQLPLLVIEPASPRRGEVVTVTGERLPPGPRRLTLLTPMQRDHTFDVTVGLDGRLRATFAMPAVEAGRCAMLLLDGSGVQSLGFAVRE